MNRDEMKVRYLSILLTLSIICTNKDNAQGSKLPNPAPIVNGEFAGPDEFKYIVSLGERGLYPHGSGSIITPRWILTARHVVLKSYMNADGIRFNFSHVRDIIVQPKYDNNLTASYWHPGYEIKKMFCYPPGDDQSVFYTDSDIALVKVDYPISLNEKPYYFKKIKMIKEELNFNNGYDITIAGWGRVLPGENRTVFRLRKATLRSSRYVGEDDESRVRPMQQIHVPGHEKSFCNGDSGGPGVVKDSRTGTELLVGVISWGMAPHCQSAAFLQSVYYYRPWIREVMKYEKSDRMKKYLCKNLAGKRYNGN